MLREVHQQLQNEWLDTSSEARIKALQRSIAVAKTTVEEMEVAYADKAKALASTKANQEATNHIISHL